MSDRLPLASFTCPRTADCYVVVGDDAGRWTYKGQRVSLRVANYFESPAGWRTETRWHVCPADEGMSWHTKALEAIACLNLSVASG